MEEINCEELFVAYEELFVAEEKELEYGADAQFLEEFLGCDENWTLDDFFDSFNPD